MVSNEGKITTFGTTGTLGGLVDGTDKLHSGILKTLWNVSNGSRVVSSGTLTQSSGTFTLATPVIYRSNGTKVTLGTTASHGQATVGAGDATYDRYDLLFIDKSANSGTGQLSIAAGTAAAQSTVADIAPEDVPVAIIKVVAGAAATATHSFQVLMSTFDKDVLNDDEVTYAKVQNVAANNVLLGNDDGAGSAIQELTKANVLTLLNVEDGADVTDATNVNAAGAVMHTDIPDSDTGFVKRTGAETYDIDTNTYLTAEADTLATVTGRGSTTTNDVTVGSLSSSKYILADASVEAGATMGVDDLYYFINVAAIALPVAASCAQRLLILKNIHSSACTITPQSGEFFDRTPSAAAGINPHPDQRVTPSAITLEAGESITLVPMTDSVSPLQNGYYVLDSRNDLPLYFTAKVGSDTNDAGLTGGSWHKVEYWDIINNETLTLDSATDGEKFTVPAGQGGLYAVHAQVGFTGTNSTMSTDSNNTSTDKDFQMHCAIYKNGSVLVRNGMGTMRNFSGKNAAVSTEVVLAAADYLEIYFFVRNDRNTSDTGTTQLRGGEYCRWSVRRVGDS